MATKTTPTRLNDEQLVSLMALAKDSDSVELKLTVPEDGAPLGDQRTLELDPLDVQIRQVFFFDTPDLSLEQARPSSSGRDGARASPTTPSSSFAPSSGRPAAADCASSPVYGVELDAMPGGFVCSASLKGG